jgi:ribosome-binding factor A
MSSLQFHHDHIRAQLEREIAWTISNRLRDPRVPSILTITEIKLAQDTRNATVMVSVFGDEKVQKSALIALNRAAPFIQNTVAQKVKMRHFPRLSFKLSHGIEHSIRINELLNEIRDELD